MKIVEIASIVDALVSDSSLGLVSNQKSLIKSLEEGLQNDEVLVRRMCVRGLCVAAGFSKTFLSSLMDGMKLSEVLLSVAVGDEVHVVLIQDETNRSEASKALSLCIPRVCELGASPEWINVIFCSLFEAFEVIFGKIHFSSILDYCPRLFKSSNQARSISLLFVSFICAQDENYFIPLVLFSCGLLDPVVEDKKFQETLIRFLVYDVIPRIPSCPHRALAVFLLRSTLRYKLHQSLSCVGSQALSVLPDSSLPIFFNEQSLPAFSMGISTSGYHDAYFRKEKLFSSDTPSSTKTPFRPLSLLIPLLPKFIFEKKVVPEVNISFSLSQNQAISLIRHPYFRPVYMNNNSETHEAMLKISLSNSAFSVSSAYMTMAPNTSQSINIYFNPLTHKQVYNMDTRGTLKIEFENSSQVVHCDVIGRFLPSFYCPVNVLDFKQCCPEEESVLVFPIQNLCNAPNNVQLIITKNKGCFSIADTHITIDPLSLIMISISFVPHQKSLEKAYESSLVIKSESMERKTITLLGLCRQSIQVSTTDLEFGNVHFSWGTLYRTIEIVNCTASFLPIYFYTSCGDIIVPENLTLEPCEKKKIRIGFLSSINGSREESLIISAPYKSVHKISISALSGSLVHAHLHKIVHFPLITMGPKIIFPIVCYVNSVQKVIISVPPSMKVAVMELEKYNDQKPSSATLSSAPRKSAFVDWELVIDGCGTVPIEITYASYSITGLFKGEMKIYLKKEKRNFLISSHVLYIASLSFFYISKESMMAKIYDYYESHTNYVTPVCDPLPAQIVEPPKDIKQVKPCCFDVKPLQICLHKRVPTAKITISNLMDSEQNFRIVAPFWISVDAPKEGTIPPYSALDFSITASLPKECRVNEKSNDVLIGFLAVFDFLQAKGLTCIPVHYVDNGPAQFFHNSLNKTFYFPQLKVGEKATKVIQLRNSLPFETVWLGRIVNNASDDQKEKSAFKLKVPRVRLRPYSLVTVEVDFASSIVGFNSSTLYFDIFESKNTDKTREHNDYVFLEATVGNFTLSVTPSVVNFPLTLPKSISKQSISIQNSAVPTILNVFSDSKQVFGSTRSLKLEKDANEVLPMSFIPFSEGAFTGSVNIECASWRMRTPYFAFCGKVEAVWENGNSFFEPSELDLGLVQVKVKKTKLFKITNNSSVPLIIKKIDMNETFEVIFVENNPQSKRKNTRETECEESTLSVLRSLKELHSESEPILKQFQNLESERDDGKIRVPFVLMPLYSVFMSVSVKYESIKKIESIALIKVLPVFGSEISVEVSFRANVIAPIILSSRVIDFETFEPLYRHTRQIKIRNTSFVPLSWEIRLDRLVLTNPSDHQNQPIQGNHHDTICFAPSNGIVRPKQTKTIDISMYSSYDCSKISALCMFSSEDYFKIPLVVMGTAALPIISFSTYQIDFETIPMGKTIEKTIKVTNSGFIRCKMTASSESSPFTCNPEFIQIEQNSTTTFSVMFRAPAAGEYSSFLNFDHTTNEGYTFQPTKIKVFGSAEYADLVVHTKEIDFGVSIYEEDNFAKIHVENKGRTEAQVTLYSYHKSLSLDADSKNITIAPFTSHYVPLIFHPTFFEDLNAKIIVKSTDVRSELFSVLVKSKVGVSSLLVEPEELFRSFDFGTCLIPGVYKKTVEITNTGNIFFSFSVNLKSEKPVPFTVSIPGAEIQVGEKILLEVTFTPTEMETYRAILDIRYGKQILSTDVIGVGGKIIASIDPPIDFLDFGICRMEKSMIKEVILHNVGNYGVEYEAVLLENSTDFSLVSIKGFCRANGKVPIAIEFRPRIFEVQSTELLVTAGQMRSKIKVMGSGGRSSLKIIDKNDVLADEGMEIKEMDIGIHTVGVPFYMNFQLFNDGPFGVDFYVEPFRIPEYDVMPRKGYIASKRKSSFVFCFIPSSEEIYKESISVLWEGEVRRFRIRASGGMGRLEFKFCDRDDYQIQELNYGIIPIGVPSEKTIFIINMGLVVVDFEALIMGGDFKLAKKGTPFVVPTKMHRELTFSPTQKKCTEYNSNLKISLQPTEAIEISIVFTANAPKAFASSLSIISETIKMGMNLIGKGGTYKLEHKGSLVFEDVAVKQIISQKLIIKNTGNIAAVVNFGWTLLKGGEPLGSYVDLTEKYGPYDPRGNWARQCLFSETGKPDDGTFTPSNYWWMIRRILFGKLFFNNDPLQSFRQKLSKTETRRRQMFYKLIQQGPATSQISCTYPPYLRVDPPSQMIAGNSEIEVKIDFNLASEETCLATLSCVSGVVGSKKYDIAFSATSRYVSVLMSDGRPIDFECQQIGNKETIRRTFKNVGSKEFNYYVTQENRTLTVYPNKGQLAVGQSVIIDFVYAPINESTLLSPIIFTPENSQPIKIKVIGSGGTSKIYFPKGKTLDFGYCMIGKDTEASLPISAQGNAVITLSNLDIYPHDSFSKGKNWPTKQVKVYPDKNYEIPFIFHPTVESPTPGRATISTASESFDIVLVGAGREAVLIVTETIIEFKNCIIGCVYEKDLHLNNIGDVNYPVKFTAEEHSELFEIFPPDALILPFTKVSVQVRFRPSKQMSGSSKIGIISPYSSLRIPVTFQSGVGNLHFHSQTIDFGVFEKLSRPVQTLVIENPSVIILAYTVTSSVPSPFSIAKTKGTINPGSSSKVEIIYVNDVAGILDDEIYIQVDGLNTMYKLKVIGECQESVIRSSEIEVLNIGICSVLEVTEKNFVVTNYGKFPLSYNIKHSYPLRILNPQGQVMGGSSLEIKAAWAPTGPFELRTQMAMVTNIGTFTIAVKGRAVFPEFAVKIRTLDFGICAIGQVYKEIVEIENKGKVGVIWEIPFIKENFSVNQRQGELPADQVFQLQVFFKAPAVGRFSGTFGIECGKQNIKEISLTGIGGNMSVSIPANVDIGDCPCDNFVVKCFSIVNSGDVPLIISIEHLLSESDKIQVDIEQQVIAKIRKTTNVSFRVMATDEGDLTTKLQINTREKTYVIQLNGKGIKIKQNELLQSIMQEPIKIKRKEPMDLFPAFSLLDFWLKKLHKKSQEHIPLVSFPEPRDREEYLIQRLIDLPIPRLTDEDADEILQAKEPCLELDFEPLLSRPPPFMAKMEQEEIKEKKHWDRHLLAPLNKSERRGKTHIIFTRK